MDLSTAAPASNTGTAVDYEAFRRELMDYMQAHCPPDIREVVRTNQKLGRREWSEWQRILNARGWGAPNWPREHGGTGWDLQQRYIFEEVGAQLDCPPLYHHGIGHIGPVIMHFGTDEQKARFLPRILDGSDWWCQGYSEPGAGSDLASLKTRAVRDGDRYVINGQKIWTSHAHEADLMYTLVSTSTEARKQAGITLLVVPLSTPGIEVRPIPTIDGWHHVNEVFLDEVAVPVANRIGAEGGGWTCAKFLLDRERLSPATVPRLARQLEQVEELLRGRLRAQGVAQPARDAGAPVPRPGVGARRARDAAQRDPGRDGRHAGLGQVVRSQAALLGARAADIVARLRRVRAPLRAAPAAARAPARRIGGARRAAPVGPYGPVLPLPDDRRRDQRSAEERHRARTVRSLIDAVHRHAAVRRRPP